MPGCQETTPNRANQRLIALIRKIPAGKVATYGQLAILAGKPHGARQVAWLLHSSSRKYDLPWHRVINSQGKISLPSHAGGDEQEHLLKIEGVEVHKRSVDLRRYLWRPESS